MTTNFYIKTSVLCLLLLFSLNTSFSQICPYIANAAFAGDATPATCDGTTQGTASVLNGGYATVSVTCGNTYTFEVCDAGWDTQMDIWNENGNIILALNDDSDDCGGLFSSGLQSYITWTANFTGVVEVHLAEYISGGLFGNDEPCVVDLYSSAPLVVTCTTGNCNDCFAGELSTTTQELVCGPTETFIVAGDGTEIIPTGVSPGYAYYFVPGDGSTCGGPAGTGGNTDGFFISGSDPAGETFDSDLGGILSANSLPVLDGEWLIYGATYEDDSGTTIAACSYSSTFVVVCFYTTADCPITCDLPAGTATYDCFNDEITVNLTALGTPSGAAPYSLSVTGGPTVPAQNITAGTSSYTFSGLANNTTYTITVDDGTGCSNILATVIADCACLSPVADADYFCTGSNDYIQINVTNPGSPTGSYTASVDGTGTPVTIDFTGTSSPSDFAGLSPTETYSIIFDDGAGCTTSIDDIYPGCRVAGSGCVDRMLDGGIESGGGAWQTRQEDNLFASVTTASTITTTLPLDGSYSIELGSWGGSGAGAGAPYRTLARRGILADPGNTTNVYFWAKFDACDSSSDELQLITYRVLLDPNNPTHIGLDLTDPSTYNVEQTFPLSTYCGTNKWHELPPVDISATITSQDTSQIGIGFILVENGASGGASRVYVDEILVESCAPLTCLSQYNLFGSPNTAQAQYVGNSSGQDLFDYETDGQITSAQIILANQNVDYDSATEITLGPSGAGFEVQLGSTFCAFIDGCNGSGGTVNPLTDDNSTNSLQSEEQSVKTTFKYKTKDNCKRKFVEGTTSTVKVSSSAKFHKAEVATPLTKRNKK